MLESRRFSLLPRVQHTPQGSWLCPSCAAGCPPRSIPSCALQAVLDRQGLEVARIEAIEQQGDEVVMRVRWYMLPEQTHAGRQV